MYVTADGQIVTAQQLQASRAPTAATQREISRRKAAMVREAVRPDENNKIHPCSICLQDYEDGIGATVPSCKHQFHVNCLEKWLEQKNTCPLCQSTAAP